MTIEYTVAEGTAGRLVNIQTATERPHALRADMVFQEDDVVFTPATIMAQHRVVTRDYGFRTGDASQRAKYVWVVDGRHVAE